MLTVAEHLEELRRRLGLCLVVLLVAIGCSLIYVEQLIAWLKQPAADLLPRLVYFSPTEPLTAYLKVGVLGGVIVAMPVILWQLWSFVRSGLTRDERRYGLGFVLWGSLQFLVGAIFAHVVLLPISLRFLLGIGARQLEPMISLERYLSFVTTVILWTGVVFELPVLLFIFAKVGIVTPEWLRQQRSYAILILVTIAAIVTPTTDAVTLLLLSGPLILLYELSIVITRIAIRRR